MAISRLKRVPIRNVWKNEEKDFTPWLEKNIDILAETLGIELSSTEREAKVGEAFEADLLVEGPNGDLVIVENQFGKSDHDHLGKIITYLTNLDAKRAIWICENPQPEHIAAVDWFNKHSPQDMGFYLIQLEAYQIENSPPAPLFSVVSEPSEQMKEAGEVKEELAERHVKRLEFWTQLLDSSKKKMPLFSNISPSKDHWLSAGAGISGVLYQYLILKDEARVQLAIEGSDAGRNKKMFDELHKSKEQIEKDFGEELVWERLEDRKSSRISKTVMKQGLRDSEHWPTIIEKMVDAMARLEKALSKHVRQLA